MTLDWMRDIPEGTGAAYGSPYAIEIDGRKFVYVSNGAALCACEGVLEGAETPNDDFRESVLRLLRQRPVNPFPADLARLVRWAEEGQVPFCMVCQGLGHVRVPPPADTTDPMPTTAWAACAGVCGGRIYKRRLGTVSGFVYDLDLLSEILGYVDAGPVMVGVVHLDVGRPLVIRSPDPLWKVMLMNRIHRKDDPEVTARFE